MLTATLSESRTTECVRRSVEIADKKLWWEITGPTQVLPPPLTVHDMAVTAVVFIAMRQGENLHIEGPVSESMLESVEDLIASWVNLRPDLYQRINVTAAEEVPDNALPVPPRGVAIAAFSGGLDSSFTVWRHANGGVGRRTRRLFAGALIHGLDVPLSAERAFAIAYANADDTLKSINVPMVVIRTNWKTEGCTHWEMEFGTGVSTCLRNWQGVVDTALLGSDEDYLRIVMPWGGNPLTYAMLSSTGFKVVYDGGEFARSEKAEGIKDWEVGLRSLRVCWEGPITGHNCGKCEKCLRTKMNFLAVGTPLPLSLPGMPTTSQVFSIRAKASAQMALLYEILDIAKGRGINEPWVGALGWSLAKNRVINKLLSPVIRSWDAFKQEHRVALAPVRKVWRMAKQRKGRV